MNRDKLRTLMKTHGYSNRELALAADVKESGISRYLADPPRQDGFSLANACKIAGVFPAGAIDPIELLGPTDAAEYQAYRERVGWSVAVGGDSGDEGGACA